jgi:hypothetical protein
MATCTHRPLEYPPARTVEHIDPYKRNVATGGPPEPMDTLDEYQWTEDLSSVEVEVQIR